MPAKQQKSGLLAKYGKRIHQAAAATVDKPVEYGRIELPPGINNGVAKLVECGFGEVAAGKQNAGEIYFSAMGVVVEPETVVWNGQEIRVAGLQTRIFEMVCDTKTRDGKTTTLDEHVARIANELKKFDPELDTSDLEAAANSLQEVGPYFHFSTSPRVAKVDGNGHKKGDVTGAWENWHGTRNLQDYTPPDATGQTQDDGEEIPPPAQSKPAAAPTKGKPGRPPKVKEPEPEPAFDEFNDIETLVSRADDTNEDEADQLAARDRLTEMAIEAGHSQEAVDAASSWQEVADMIGTPPSATNDDAAAGEWEGPEKGQVFGYVPLDPKTKKPGKTSYDCEVTAVNKKARTCDLKNIDNAKLGPYKGVSWDELSS